MLFITYVLFLKHINKSWITIVICAALLSVLALIQYQHFEFYSLSAEPLTTPFYRFLILCAPPLFFLLGRAILFVDRKQTPWLLLHLLPITLAFITPKEISIPVAFLLGTAYSLWLSQVIYQLKNTRKQFDLALVFLLLFSVIAVIVLLLAVFVTQIESSYFYHFYTLGIGLSFMFICAALIVAPNALIELGELVRLNYVKSTLDNIDIKQTKKQLKHLMDSSKMYQNESLSLLVLAKELQISSHQLSEFINTQFEMNFSNYIRFQRVEASKVLLKKQAQSSILSISMEVGFKSQSNFYVAFKSITGLSPGQYRKSD